MTTGCVPAEPGSFVNPGDSTSQVKCEPGTYQSQRGQSSCMKSPIGNYVDTAGAKAPTKCPAGTYQPFVGQVKCLAASNNFYVPGSGESRQTPCPANAVQPLTGQTSCTLVDEELGTTSNDAELSKKPTVSVTTLPLSGSSPAPTSSAPATTTPVTTTTSTPITSPATTTPPEKPTMPAVAKSVKVGKSLTISARGGKTSQGLVVVATTSTTTCVIRETAAGFSVTGVKAGACRVKVTVIGDSRFLTLTTEFQVIVTK
jgi:hypothetical protein